MAPHTLPLKCRIVPPSPTAKTFAVLVPQTPRSVCEVPELIDVHVVPSKCRITPPLPTAYTSEAPKPNTLCRTCAVGDFIVLHVPPVSRMIVPLCPTANAVELLALQTAKSFELTGIVCDVQFVPSKWKRLPFPTANTSDALFPNTPLNGFFPLRLDCHRVPS